MALGGRSFLSVMATSVAIRAAPISSHTATSAGTASGASCTQAIPHLGSSPLFRPAGTGCHHP
jgi:hypothetical protein